MSHVLYMSHVFYMSFMTRSQCLDPHLMMRTQFVTHTSFDIPGFRFSLSHYNFSDVIKI